MFYVYHGEDEFSRSEEVAQRKQQVMAAGMGDLNITELDGRRLTFEELVNACQAVPFLAERRLVIVHDLLQRFDGARAARGRRAATDGARAVSTADAAFAEQLVAYLPHMPPSTRLVFVDAKALNASNPVLKAAQRSKDGFIKLFTVPEGRALDNWVRERAQQHGAPITPQATELLTAAVGANLRQLDRELAKLAAYANYARDISAEDVRTLVQATRESDIFGLVDSLGARRREEALRHLEELLADPDAHELYILTMIARQVRLILAAKELAEEQGQGVDAVQRELRLSRRFIAEKVISQARMFRMEELEALLRRVAELDQAIKTGQIEGPLGLEMLIVESCRQGARRQGRPPAPRRATRRQPSRKAARTR
ncbi:MAG TPA: DNA polymerase III subunit delta [Chloroflexi bacterium]|jgi:DNA polymerase-3 subunit delta|nr:DNA polymerase III subunit delta [Chloroflexota bacterium]